MGSPKVRIKEIDLSTRVPSFPGVYGAIVIPAVKGPVNEKKLVTSDSDFLREYTPDQSVEVGYSNAYFSALAFLQQSDKLWVVRAAADDALYGGVAVKSIGSSTNNFALPSGQTDPSAYVFDSSPDVDGVKEKSLVECVADVSGSLDGKYFILPDASGTVAFWFDNGDSGTVEPEHGADRGVEINTVADDDDAATVASKVASVIANDAAFESATVQDIDDVLVTDASTGARSGQDAGTSGFTVSVDTEGVDEVDATDEALLLYQKDPGVWGSSIGVKIVSYDTDPETVKEPDSFIVQVFKSSNESTPEEEFLCSRKLGKKDGYNQNIFVEDVLEGSSYIRAISNTVVDENEQPKDQSTILYLSGGDNGSAVTDSEMITALQVLSNPDDIYFTVLMDGDWTTPAFHQAMDTLVSNRKDSVAVLSTPYSDEAASTYMTDLVDYRRTELNLNSSYSAIYTPHTKIYDRFNDRNLYVAPDGYAAAAISATASNYEIWFPPAGFKRGMVNVLDLRRRFTSGEMDVLYDAGINPLRFAPGRGILIWGQKTLLLRPSSLDRLNVRLLLVSIEPRIAEALEDFMFDINDAATRSQVTAVVSSAMDRVKAGRGVTDYQVVCDTSNNTPADINNNKLVVDLYLKPAKSIEDIPFRVIITREGVDFSQAEQAL